LADSNEDGSLLQVTAEVGEYSDAPGDIVSSLKVAFALASGRRLNAAEHEKVRF
jgi:hypothetical protein